MIKVRESSNDKYKIYIECGICTLTRLNEKIMLNNIYP